MFRFPKLVSAVTVRTCLSQRPELTSRMCVRRCASGGGEGIHPQKAVLKEMFRNFTIAFSIGMGALYYVCFHYKPPVKVEDVEEEQLERYQDPLMSKDAAMVRIKGYWLPEYLQNSSKKGFKDVEAFPLRNTDIIVASFPKSGTTWVQQIVYLMQNSPTDSSAQLTMEDRFPYLEYIYPGLKELKNKPSPRLMKTHLPFELLPSDTHRGIGKVIYIARNPKDVCVSYYHFVKMLAISDYKGTFENFATSFVIGRVNYGSWFEHVRSFWKNRDNWNILFIRYEDLHKRPEETVKKIATFLGKEISAQQTKDIVKLSSFDKMKADPATNYSWWDDLGLHKKGEAKFMRKGKIGDWKNHFSSDMSGLIDTISKDEFDLLGLKFEDS